MSFFSFFFYNEFFPLSSFPFPYDRRHHAYQHLPKQQRKRSWWWEMWREPQIYSTVAVVLVSWLQSTVPSYHTPPPFLFFFPVLFLGQQLCVNRMWELQWNVFKSCTPPSSPLAAVCILPGTSALDKYRENSSGAERALPGVLQPDFSSLFFNILKYGKNTLLLTASKVSWKSLLHVCV